MKKVEDFYKKDEVFDYFLDFLDELGYILLINYCKMCFAVFGFTVRAGGWFPLPASLSCGSSLEKQLES